MLGDSFTDRRKIRKARLSYLYICTSSLLLLVESLSSSRAGLGPPPHLCLSSRTAPVVAEPTSPFRCEFPPFPQRTLLPPFLLKSLCCLTREHAYPFLSDRDPRSRMSYRPSSSFPSPLSLIHSGPSPRPLASYH